MQPGQNKPMAINAALVALLIMAILVVVRAVRDYSSAPESGTDSIFLVSLALVLGCVLAMLWAIASRKGTVRWALAVLVLVGWANMAWLLQGSASGILLSADMAIMVLASIAAALLWSGSARTWFA